MEYRPGAEWVDNRKLEQAREICLRMTGALTRKNDEEARDLASGFVLKVTGLLRVRCAPWPFSEEMTAWLETRAIRFIRTEMERARCDGKRFCPRPRTTETDAPGESVPQADVHHNVPDKKPGPGHLAITRDILRVALLEIKNESPAARKAFLDHFLDEKRFTDLARETGMSADSQWQLCARVVKRIKAHLAGVGITNDEILDLLNAIDRGGGC